MCTAKVAVLRAAERELAKGNIATHLRYLKIAKLCPK